MQTAKGDEDARVSAARSGGAVALRELVRFAEAVAWGALLGHWRGRRLEPDRREDVVQEALARIVEKVTRTDKAVQDLQDWVRGSVHTLLLENWRRTARDARVVPMPLDTAEPGVDGGATDPVSHSLRREEREVVEACMNDLPEKDRELLELRYRDGLRNREIAERVGRTEKAVELAIPRALLRMRACLSRRGAGQ